MLAMHFVQHHFDGFPLSDLVKACFGVVVKRSCGSLIGHEGKEFAEESTADGRHGSVVSR